ncbi:cytochrome ubiquinol oxidase subunit I [Kaistia geumhonensis]|uniref:Cytochrome d ubiquinol oxidase subunit I n=1 Tax=Kaistia geumhonensis TaxID=410839 RepID=A0ABU0M8R1_9HYPH|nr:cytochrome ubiquinol oxidase subunit I [Kaistia geumhonensis]MCX5477435.1 cytochrome ubiquinol oxidase subunit I [Kaistia geumhonensis]MDQ0517358.1 cytochrome d ubiquinol oxidase subunit I [Kaistia geumhonensis]
MDLTPLLLSRIQFAFTISFHIIFPAFTIGLAAWLTFLEACGLITGERIYRRLSDFWLKIFAVTFGLGVVSGIVMAFQFGTNWSELARRTGPIQGPLLGYESFTGFALEATFFGVLMFGRDRVPRWAYFLACLMVSIGTSLSAYWIMVNNSWMQYPTGYSLTANGVFVPDDWPAILFSEAVRTRFPHMVLAAYVTSAFCVAATGAWYMLRGTAVQEGRAMAVMGLRLAAILVPLQLLFGHLVGDYVHDRQPAKFAAIEGRWNDQQPASEILIAWPDPKNERNLFEIAVPYLGSIIGSMSLTSKEIGLKSFAAEDRPPVAIPFFSFRIMVGCGLLMLAIAWVGTWLSFGEGLLKARLFLVATSLSFPLGFVATITGWYTAEVGRQPWSVYGQLRTADAVTPVLTSGEVATTLTLIALIYALIFGFGALYIYRLLRAGPIPTAEISLYGTNPKRPLSLPGASPGVTGAAGIGD